MVCAQCGEEIPERFRFCGVCGTPIAAPQEVARDERKVVSVLFVDLVGFTAVSDGADPEEVSARLRPYHATLKREIEKLGGTVEKFIGDAVMAVFGAPVAYEDDAERAVRAALRVTEAIDELNEAQPGLALAVRAAVNTGEVLASLTARPDRGEGIVTGDVVNVASRLQGVAPVGGVAVGEATYRATRFAIDYTPSDPVRVKGKQEPLNVWHALRTLGFSPEIQRNPSTPFIGRRKELEALQAAFTAVARDRSAALATVIGEPGVGKSRLLSEFFNWIEDRPVPVLWRHGRCPRYGDGITFWALAEIVKTQAGILDSDDTVAAAVKLAAAVDAVVEADEREWVRTLLAPLVGITASSAAAGRAELFSAWSTFIRAIASHAPLVLVIEDLHWADGALVQFLQQLIPRVSDLPVLLLCTARPELPDQHPGWGGGVTVGLAPLDRADTETLISALLADSRLSSTTRTEVLERSGGNPLYAEEFVRMLSDTGALNGQEGATVAVPDTVQALIAARLDTLIPEEKAQVYDAAVLGRIFWSGGVAELAGRPEAEIGQSLQTLARKEFVRAAPRSSIDGQDEYAFWHALVQDVAYRQIPRAVRSVKHRAAADWLEATAGRRDGDHVEVLAFHYTEALRLAPVDASSGDADGAVHRAVDALVASGARAQHLDLEKAATFYRRAIDLLSDADARRGRLLCQLGWVDSDRGLNEEARQHFEAAITALEASGDRVGEGEARALLARTVWRLGDSAVAWEQAERAVAILADELPGPEQVDALNEVGRLCMVSSRYAEAISSANQAIEVASGLGLRAPQVRALVNRGVSRGNLGDHEAGTEDLRQARRLALDLGLGLETIPAYANLAWSLGDTEGPEAALEVAREGADFAQRRGLAFPTSMLKTIQAEFSFKRGRWATTLELAADLLEWESSHRAPQIRIRAAREQCRVLVLSGEVERAATMYAELLGQARKAADPQTVIPILAVGATIGFAQDDAAVVTERAREVLGIDAPDLRLRELPVLTRALTGAGEIDLAESLMDGLTPTTRRHRAALASAAAEIAEARGDTAAGAARHAEAAEGWERFGDAVEAAWARLGHGRCLVREGAAEEAHGPLTAARQAFADFGAPARVDEIDVWLEQVGPASGRGSGL